MQNYTEQDLENILQLLDGFCEAGESRIKLHIDETKAPGEVKHDYHHGRCDIGSPWAKGTAFDVLE